MLVSSTSVPFFYINFISKMREPNQQNEFAQNLRRKLELSCCASTHGILAHCFGQNAALHKGFHRFNDAATGHSCKTITFARVKGS